MRVVQEAMRGLLVALLVEMEEMEVQKALVVPYLVGQDKGMMDRVDKEDKVLTLDWQDNPEIDGAIRLLVPVELLALFRYCKTAEMASPATVHLVQIGARWRKWIERFGWFTLSCERLVYSW
jgi:hypothetical protein